MNRIETYFQNENFTTIKITRSSVTDLKKIMPTPFIAGASYFKEEEKAYIVDHYKTSANFIDYIISSLHLSENRLPKKATTLLPMYQIYLEHCTCPNPSFTFQEPVLNGKDKLQNRIYQSLEFQNYLKKKSLNFLLLTFSDLPVTNKEKLLVTFIKEFNRQNEKTLSII